MPVLGGNFRLLFLLGGSFKRKGRELEREGSAENTGEGGSFFFRLTLGQDQKGRREGVSREILGGKKKGRK